MNNRLTKQFANVKSEGRAAFVAYLCAGDPSFEASLSACKSIIENGVDILELGVPFSDPLADGLTNQLAAERALDSGMNQEKVLDLVSAIRELYPEIPIVLYTYYNLVFANGLKASVAKAAKAGVDAFLTLDLPPEESEEMDRVCNEEGVSTVYIVAPTTPVERISKICNKATGFIYYVSREGVTGIRDSIATNLEEKVNEIKKKTDLPVVVGFGISKPEHVSQVAQVADGVVVGSALVNCIPAAKDSTEISEKLGKTVANLVSGLK